MMRTRKLLWLLSLTLATIACKKEDIKIFDNAATGIYFQQTTRAEFTLAETYTDSLGFSFATTKNSTIDSTLKIRIRTMGNVKDYPRPIKLVVDAANTTAVAGVNYTADFSTAVIPAGASEIQVPIKLLRTSDLLGGIKFNLALKLEENEHFKPYLKKQDPSNIYNGTAARIDADRFLITISEIYTRPSYWGFMDGAYGAANNYLGAWSINKFKMVNEIAGWSPADWLTAGTAASPVKLGTFGVVTLTMRNELQRLADSGTPMRELDGSLMQLGPGYLVRY